VYAVGDAAHKHQRPRGELQVEKTRLCILEVRGRVGLSDELLEITFELAYQMSC